MKVGFIGLGRMGLPMVKRISETLSVVAFDVNSSARTSAMISNVKIVESIHDLVQSISSPRVIWLMIPLGNAVDGVIEELLPMLNSGDMIVDGGNADYLDSIRRNRVCESKQIYYSGVGTSGGVEGAYSGPPMSVDCSPKALELLKPVLNALGGNYSHFEKPGHGHLAKTIHNAIEYGMMQSLAEGVNLYEKHGFSEREIREVMSVWSKGSIIESRLLNCLNKVLQNYSLKEPCNISKSETLALVKGSLHQSAKTPIIGSCVSLREHPGDQDQTTRTVLARLRNAFGGHAIVQAKKDG